MAVTTTLAALSQTRTNNGVDGSTDAPSTLDDQIQYLGSFIAILRDNAMQWGVGSLTASVATSALTVALKTVAGSDPAAADAVYIAFRSATAGTGTVTARAVTSATSLVVPSTATMGQTNGVAARLWVAAIDNAGTVELAIINTQTSAGICPISENQLISTTALSTGADSAGVWYSTTARSNVAFRLIGYIENTQATAGTWATTPSVIQAMGPGVRRPGEPVQVQSVFVSGAVTRTGSTAYADAAGMTCDITPTSAVNKVRVDMGLVLQQSGVSGVNAQSLAQLLRGATVISGADAFPTFANSSAGGLGSGAGHSFHYMDGPASTSAQTYKLQHKTTDATGTATSKTFSLVLTEVMA